MAYIIHKTGEVEDKIRDLAQNETLLMGDSRSQRLNGSLFSSQTAHFGSPAEHYYYTYHKLRRIVQVENHKLERVVLTLSIHNFSPMYNRLNNSDFAEGKTSLQRHLYFVPFDELIVGGKLKPWDLSGNSLLKSIYGGPYWGGHRISKHANPNSSVIATTLNVQFTKSDDEPTFAYSNRVYALKIDSLCKAEDISLFVVSSPYHKNYLSQISDEYVTYFYDVIDEMQHAVHVDYLSEEPDVMWMSDANHLNETGANLYSEKINDEVHSGLLVTNRKRKRRYSRARKNAKM
ncbi:MAG: hypothetical protein WBA74_27270 [Cyclobacteriaceae bacterium]